MAAKPIGKPKVEKPRQKTMYKTVRVMCKYCGVEIGDEQIEVSSDKTHTLGVCKWARCQNRDWVVKAKLPARVRQATSAGVGSLYIRQALPAFATFPVQGDYDTEKSMFISGPVGTGKTWLLMAAACEALALGLTVRVVSWRMFQMEVRATYQPGSEDTELDVFNNYQRLDVLCLDDLDAGSEAAATFLLTLLDERYKNMKTTHITSNMTKDQAGEHYDQRIERRINEMCRSVVLTKKI